MRSYRIGTWSRVLASCGALAFAMLVGHVSDKTTGQPLGGITVSVSGPTHATTKTRQDGSYALRTLRDGRYTVTISSNDVPPTTRRLVVRGKRTKANFTVCSMTLDYSCDTSALPGPG